AEQVETQLSILVGNLANALVQDDLHTVDYLLKNGTSAHGIVAVTVYDRQGAVLSQSPVVAGKVTPAPNPEGCDLAVLRHRRPRYHCGHSADVVRATSCAALALLRVAGVGAGLPQAGPLAWVRADGVEGLQHTIGSHELPPCHRAGEARQLQQRVRNELL